MKDINVTTTSGEEVTFSWLHNLIMLHGDSISAQWSPAFTGIELTTYEERVVKIGFHTIGSDSQTYQSWLFGYEHLEELRLFFTFLGYRV